MIEPNRFRLPLSVCDLFRLKTLMFVTGMLSLVFSPAHAQKTDFSHDIVPVLKKHCAKCHTGEKAEGGFSFNTRNLLMEAEVVAEKDASKSRLVELIESTDPEDQMPPKDHARLSEKEVAAIRKWIDGGVVWEPGFTFGTTAYEPPLKPRRFELPVAKNGRDNPVDRILDQYLEQNSIEVPKPLDDAAFLRRLYLDVLGLPPSEAELNEFLSDPVPEKREDWVDRVLNRDREYAEHWMTFWNDLLRNAYAGTGYIDGGRKQITGWLYKSLLENKPFDRFVRELIVPVPESEGFIHGIQWRGNVNASQVREIQFSQNISQVFLGINMKCASCHDSFIDRWTLDQAYGLAAVYSTRELEIHRCDKPTGRMAQASWLFPELGEIDASADQRTRLSQLASLVTHEENGRFARTITNRLWQRLMGRGLVHPVDAMHTAPWNADLLDYLGTRLVDENHDIKRLLHVILLSQAYQSQTAVLDVSEDAEDYVYHGPLAKRMTAEQFMDSVRSVLEIWPDPDPDGFKIDGRGQGGQLAAFLSAHGGKVTNQWQHSSLRAALLAPDPLQASLGRPNRDQVVTMRPSTMTTLEAIHLANGPELSELLTAGASKMASADNLDMDQLITRIYHRALSRSPDSEELALAKTTLGEKPGADAIADLLWMVFMLPEFHLVR